MLLNTTLPASVRLPVLLALAWAAVACGGKAKQIPSAAPGTTSGLTGESNCVSKSDCPAAAPGYGASMAAAGAFVGWVGEPVDWRVFGIDENTRNADGTTSGRRMVVLLDNVPTGSRISPDKDAKLSNEATITWTPDEEMSGTFDIIVRDYERCQQDQGTGAACEDYRFLKAYDKRFKSVRWETKDRAKLEEELASGTIPGDTSEGVTTVDATCSSDQASADPTTKILSTFIQALSNPAGLAGMATTVFSGAMGGTPGC